MAGDNLNGENPNMLHIVMFPWLAYGHMMPYLRVSIQLAEMGHRISFLSTPKNVRSLQSHVPLHVSHLINFFELPLPSVDGLPASAESTAEIRNNQVPYLKKAYDLLQPSVTEFLQNSNRVDWIIQDVVSHWMPEVAFRLKIDLAMFIIFSATTMAFFGPLSMLINGTRVTKHEDLTVTPQWMDYPTSVRFHLHELVSHDVCMDSNLSDWDRFAKAIQGSKFVAMRSCREFELDAIRVLERIYDIPAIPLGLLHPKALAKHAGGAKDGGGDDQKWLKLKNWLDTKEEKTVMYVAFGSEVILKPAAMHDLATGIEKSGAHFVWVLRDRDMLPTDYEARVSGRGFIWSGWAPQVDVLSHPSVGGFLTHCGWSSVVEALGLGRALVLFSGGSSDMGLVARQVHERRLGLEVPRNEGDGSFTVDGVSDTIRRVMIDDEGAEIRANAWAAREVICSADVQDRCIHELNRALVDLGTVGPNRDA
ncbi:hypothetical protein MLD38_014271 [Melastoma candidum]|uniref:Uncharacterized protein n=1 Tax=Melastoma candidum TaxID=119954 RepID=A0ACB9RCU0_9MYRT|nr:hypothetical protein MLD38_014271 [Melastoma candidum]